MIQKKLELLKESIAVQETKNLIEVASILLDIAKSSEEVLCVNERILVITATFLIYVTLIL